MNEGTVEADGPVYQRGRFSYMHAIRDDGQSVEDAMAQADAFVRQQFELAKKLLAEGKVTEAYKQFSFGLHALQDATSPAHAGFKKWSDHVRWPFQLSHVLKELHYPGKSSNLQKVTNQYLDWFEHSNEPLPKENLFSGIKHD